MMLNKKDIYNGVFLFLFLVVGCIKNEPLTNDSDVRSSMSTIQADMAKAVGRRDPTSMKITKNDDPQLRKAEWALFHYRARLYTTPYQSMGYAANQVLDKSFTTMNDENGNPVDVMEISVLDTQYDEPQNPNDPPTVSTQKQWDCDYAMDPYRQWVTECDLAPYYNFLLFYPFDSDPGLFFNYKKYTKKERLPEILVQENRCYGLPNCEYTATYMEFDIITYRNGKRERTHVINTFTEELPYLASNPLQCIGTLVEINNQMHPYEICRDLINFTPGE